MTSSDAGLVVWDVARHVKLVTRAATCQRMGRVAFSRGGELAIGYDACDTPRLEWQRLEPAPAIAFVATLLVCPLFVVLSLALVYARFAGDPQVAGALRGMGAVAAGLVMATGIKLMPALARNPLGLGLCAVFGTATFVAVAWLRLPLAGVLAVVGGLACVACWRRLAP